MAFGAGSPLYVPGLTLIGQLPTSANAATYSAAIAAATGQVPGPPFAVPEFPFLLELSNFVIGGSFDHASGSSAIDLATYSPSYGFKAGASSSLGGQLAWADAVQGVYYGLSYALVGFPLPTGVYKLFSAGPNLVPTTSVSLTFSQGAGPTFIPLVFGMRVIDNRIFIWGNFTQVAIGAGAPVTRLGIVVFDAATLALLGTSIPLFVDSTVFPGGHPFVTDIVASSTHIFVACDRYTGPYSTFNYTGLFKLDRTTLALDTTFQVSAVYADPFAYTIFLQRTVPCIAIDEPNGFVYYGGYYSQLSNVGPSDPTPVSRTSLARIDIVTGAISTAFHPILGPATGSPYPSISAMIVDPTTSILYAGGSLGVINGTTYDPSSTPSLLFSMSSVGVVGIMHEVLNGEPCDMIINNGDLVVGGALSTVNGITRQGGFSLSLTTAALSGFNPQVTSSATTGTILTVRFG